MKNLTIAAAAAGLFVLLILSGCSTHREMVYGEVVEEPSSIIGSQAPRIAFKDDQGVVRRLYSDNEVATIIAFVDHPCSPPDSNLVAVSNRLAGDAMVVEICASSAPGGCESHGDCVKSRGQAARHLVSLCDNSNNLRQWFENRTDKKVFLLDQYGVVRFEGSLSDLERIQRKAREFVEEYREEMDEMIYTG
jgi:hypothetical protein